MSRNLSPFSSLSRWLSFFVATAFLSLSFARGEAAKPANFDKPLQAQLLDAELELSAAHHLGIGPKHPKIAKLQKRLDVFKRYPQVKNELYWKLVRERKLATELKLLKLPELGFGPKHPEVKATEQQLKTLKMIEAAHHSH